MNKLTFFVRRLGGGGAQRVMLRLATGFAQLGYDVEIVTLDRGGSFVDETERVPIIELSSSRLSTCLPELVRYLKLRSPSVLMSTEVACNLVCIAAGKLSGCKVVVREGLHPTTAKRSDPYLSTRIGYRLAPLLYPHADGVIALAPALADDLSVVARIPRKKIHVISHNPVVNSALIAESNQPPRHSWLSDGKSPVIVAVGRLEAQKRFDVLVRAFKLVSSTKSCRLVIFGEGSERRNLERLVTELNLQALVSLPGFTQSPYADVAASSCFVLSSDYEGLPNALIEALACGAPVVSTDCPTGPFEVLEGGRYGRLVSPGDDRAMANAILATLISPPDRDAQRARGNEYSIERSAKMYEAMLLEVGALSSNGHN